MTKDQIAVMYLDSQKRLEGAHQALGAAIDAFRNHGLTLTAQFKEIERAYDATAQTGQQK